MAKRRITRKQIKRKDQFLTGAERITLWLTERGWKKITAFLVILSVLLLLSIMANRMFSTKRVEASAVYGNAVSLYIQALQPVAGQFIENREILDQALKEFEKVIENHGSSSYAPMAQYYRVLCLFRLGKEKKSFEEGQKLFEGTSEDIVKNLTGFFLIEKYQNDEKYAEAHRLISEMEADSNSLLNINQLYYAKAMLYEQEGKLKEAVQEYIKILKNKDLFSYKSEAQQRLALIDPKALEEVTKAQE